MNWDSIANHIFVVALGAWFALTGGAAAKYLFWERGTKIIVHGDCTIKKGE